MLKKTKLIYIALVFLIIILLVYFFWPHSLKVGNEEQITIEINNDQDNGKCLYDLNKQEVGDFVKLLKKSRFYHGVSKPDRFFSDKIIYVRVVGYRNTLISIYYDTNKTFVFADMSGKTILSPYYRISNKDEIRKFIEDIVNTKNAEFKPISTY